MNKPKILVTGASGQLGRELKLCSESYDQYEFIFATREDYYI
jgi:dTDP-4-dehydrorhamnose reductase